jgi:arylformamidase
MKNAWVDISVQLHTGMVHWPDNPLKTRNSSRCWESDMFFEDFVYISQEAARYLASVGVQTVGVDYLSVGGYTKDGTETHQALLEAGIWIIEGLDLSQVEPGMCELICLPLKIADRDGAPARAILRQVVEDDNVSLDVS